MTSLKTCTFTSNTAEHFSPNMTTPLYDEIPKYSQAILAGILRNTELKMHLKLSTINDSFRDNNFVATKVKLLKCRRKTFTSNALLWLKHVCKTVRPI